MFGTCVVEGKEETFWHENIDEVMNNRLGLHLNSNPAFEFNGVDVIFGGNHEQGSF